jgi:hypothetical protein
MIVLKGLVELKELNDQRGQERTNFEMRVWKDQDSLKYWKNEKIKKKNSSKNRMNLNIRISMWKSQNFEISWKYKIEIIHFAFTFHFVFPD